MKFSIIENIEGEKAHPFACVLDITEPPTGSEIAAIATVDARRFWKFVRCIKRRHPKKFEKEASKPGDVLTIALMKAPGNESDLTKCAFYASIEGEYFGLAPRWQEEYDLPFASPVPESVKFDEFLKSSLMQETLSDYYAFLTDTAEEYWSQAELRKNDTDRDGIKMCMEFRQMHTHYQMMADELLRYMNNKI